MGVGSRAVARGLLSYARGEKHRRNFRASRRVSFAPRHLRRKAGLKFLSNQGLGPFF